jgi:diguanylate cyclase (GGDEF)-like protein
MAAKINSGSIGEILKDFTPGESGRIYLVNGKGNLITNPWSTSGEPTRDRLDISLGSLATREDSSVVEYSGLQQQPVVGTFRDVPALDWTIVAEIPQQEAFAQIARLRNVTAWIVVVLLLVVGSIAYALAQIIVRPLDRLASGAALVASGDLAVDLPVMSGGEVGYLTQVFNNMVAHLREGRHELDAINQTLSKQNVELALRSVTDVLTGLHNRRHLMETLEQEAKRSRRRERGFGILMIDVDHFKKYNDTFGHLAGDAVLIRLATILKEQAREVDCAARYGGEEFVVMLPETELQDAVHVAERIRAHLSAENFGSASEHVAVTLSIGVAEFPPDGATPESVLACADLALYKAKSRGRDRVISARRRRVSRPMKKQA